MPLRISAPETEFAIELRNSGKIVLTEISRDDEFAVHDLAGVDDFGRRVLAILEKDVG